MRKTTVISVTDDSRVHTAVCGYTKYLLGNFTHPNKKNLHTTHYARWEGRQVKPEVLCRWEGRQVKPEVLCRWGDEIAMQICVYN